MKGYYRITSLIRTVGSLALLSYQMLILGFTGRIINKISLHLHNKKCLKYEDCSKKNENPLSKNMDNDSFRTFSAMSVDYIWLQTRLCYICNGCILGNNFTFLIVETSRCGPRMLRSFFVVSRRVRF